jgi:NADPH:quinone reductase-like Zn-dependent oxidoreductase
MRAVVAEDYGSPPVVADLPTPQPQAGQVLIKLAAAGMNPMDRALAGGFWRPMPATFPMVLGADFAGTIESVGEGATAFAVGQQVFGQSFVAPLGSAGTYAEYLVAAADVPMALVPAGLDPVVAAALPTAGMTAMLIVEGVVGPLDGKSVLIVGAAGGVGSYATQFAANAGARVIANARPAAAARLREYGAQDVIDHTDRPLVDSVREAYPDGVDVVLDLVSDPESFEAHAALVRPGGTAVSTRYVADAASNAGEVTRVNYALQPSGEVLARLADAVVSGRIAAPPITRIPLDGVPAFLAATDLPPVEGKTIVTI